MTLSHLLVSFGQAIDVGNGGVAAFHNPPKWLKETDTVEIEIENIGKIKNKMTFVKE